MAKKQTPETTALTPVSAAGALAVAETTDARDARGKENITRSDMQLPRLAIAQQLSPALDPDKPEYIDGLKLRDLYNTVTQEIYGPGPLSFVVIRLDKRGIEFDADGNIVDFDVPLNDPRLQFTTGADGSREKPQATLFYDYLIVLVPSQELVVLSMKGTATKTAKKLNSYLQIRKGPAWAGQYTVEAVKDQRGQYTFGNFLIKPNGATPPDVVEFASTVYDNLQGVRISTDREVDPADNPDEY